MSMRSLAVAAMAMTLLGVLPAVSRAQQPLPGIPMVPVDHPALALQPTMGGSQPNTPASDPSPAGKKAGQPMAPKPPAEPETVGPKRAGKDLKKAVATVTKLHWHDKLGEARVRAAASGKPILFLQALGDLEGFA